MYQILGVDQHVFFEPPTSPSTFNTLNERRMTLQGRIKEACQGHLRWCFDKDVFLAKKSWPISKDAKKDIDSLQGDPGLWSFNGSLHLLKLFEFSSIFIEEGMFIEDCLRACANLWLDILNQGRDAKSGLWYRYRETYVPWEGQKYEESETLNLPEYRLGELIYIWKALQSVEHMVVKFATNQDFSTTILVRLGKLGLYHFDVRKLILTRFICLNLDSRSNMQLSPPTMPITRGQSSDAKPKIETEGDAYAFVIAVRRSRVRDRTLFYAKDTLVYEGFGWGFFENDLKIEMPNPQNEIVKPEVSLAWKQTLRSQGIHQEAIWKKSLRYALAISMANEDKSLDRSKDPAELAKISCEQLHKLITPCGMFTSKVYWRMNLQDARAFLDDPRSTWEVSTVLLRHRFKAMDLDL